MSLLARMVGGAAIIGAALINPAYAETVVRVSLIDKVGELDLSKSMGLGMGMGGDMSMAGMGINVSPKAVPHGEVKFSVTNLASQFVHEVIIAQVPDTSKPLTYIDAKNVVDQEAVRTLAQVSEIEPNKTASFTILVKPGKYILYCNLPGHYMAGMWAVIDVQ